MSRKEADGCGGAREREDGEGDGGGEESRDRRGEGVERVGGCVSKGSVGADRRGDDVPYRASVRFP